MMRLQTIYEYLGEYSKEEIDKALSMLKDNEKELVKERYGNDLNKPIRKTLDKKDNSRFYGTIIPKIKRIINKNRVNKSLENDVKELSKKKTENKKINNKNLLDRKQELCQYLTDDSKKNIEEKMEEKEMENKKEELIEEEVKYSTIEKNDAIKLLEIVKSPSFNELMTTLGAKDAIIVGLKLGYVDGKYFSTSSIANFLDISEEEVREITKKVLLVYKKNIVSYIDNAIFMATDKKIK